MIGMFINNPFSRRAVAPRNSVSSSLVSTEENIVGVAYYRLNEAPEKTPPKPFPYRAVQQEPSEQSEKYIRYWRRLPVYKNPKSIKSSLTLPRENTYSPSQQKLSLSSLIQVQVISDHKQTKAPPYPFQLCHERRNLRIYHLTNLNQNMRILCRNILWAGIVALSGLWRCKPGLGNILLQFRVPGGHIARYVGRGGAFAVFTMYAKKSG